MWAYIPVIIDLFTHQEEARGYILTHFPTGISRPGTWVHGPIYSKESTPRGSGFDVPPGRGGMPGLCFRG